MINSWNFRSDKLGIVLSGGGGKGAYQVGVLKCLCETNFIDCSPSFISGVSVGSINASALAQHNRSEFSLSMENLEKFWREDITRNDDVIQFKFPKYLSGLWSLSLGKADKLEKILKRRIDIEKIRNSDIALKIGAVNMRTGQMREFDNFDPFLFEGILASSAYPFAFPPVRIEDSLYIDGGVRDLAPLKRAIDYGVDNIVCISTDHTREDRRETPINNVFDLGRNLIRICSADNFKNDVKKLIATNRRIKEDDPRCHSRRRPIGIMVFKPSRPLGDTFDFSKEKTEWRIKLGYEDAMNMIFGP